MNNDPSSTTNNPISAANHGGNPIRMLVCVRDESHASIAVKYAGAKLKARGGKLIILHVQPLPDFQSFSSIASRIQQENQQKSEAMLTRLTDIVQQWAGESAILLQREGFVADEIIRILDDHGDIQQLILGASTDGESQHQILTELIQKLGKRLFVPIVIVPSHLTDQQIRDLA